jgi:predicted ATPase
VAELVPVRSVRVRTNEANQQFELEVQEASGQWLGARALSEGTLRFLALSTVAADPRSARLVCLEEPENGIHPLRLEAMLELLDRIAVDPEDEPGSDNPVRQVLVNTHSPLLVQMLERQNRSADLLIAEPATIRRGDTMFRTVRFRHRADTWREIRGGPGVGPGIAEAYLTRPAGSQLPMMVADGD